MSDLKHEIELIRAQAELKLRELEAHSPAKDVAGRVIGKQGLFYIAVMLLMVIVASVLLDKDKIAAVTGLLGAALMAVISMVSGVAGANPKQEKPEFEVIRELIHKLDKLSDKEPMRVDVAEGRVTVTKGEDSITTKG